MDRKQRILSPLGALRGTGNTRFPLIANGGTTWLTVGLAWLLLSTVGGGLVAIWAGGKAAGVDLGSAKGGVYGVLQSAGLLFFAFAGYARIATLGEEVRDPARTIPRAIPIALGITVVLYLVGREIIGKPKRA